MAFAHAWPRLVAAGFLLTVAGKGASGCPPNLGGRASRLRVMPTVQPQSVPITRLKRRNDFLCVAHRGHLLVHGLAAGGASLARFEAALLRGGEELVLPEAAPTALHRIPRALLPSVRADHATQFLLALLAHHRLNRLKCNAI